MIREVKEGQCVEMVYNVVFIREVMNLEIFQYWKTIGYLDPHYYKSLNYTKKKWYE